MEITQFDLKAHDIRKIADLIVNAQTDDGETGPRKSRGMVMDLIRAGNNFLGHENIYISSYGNEITGLTIGYNGKGKDEFGTLLRLLISLRMSEFLSYLTLTARLLHGGFTPNIEDDEFYISALAVDERYRRKGIGSLLLRHTIQTARNKNCKNIVLEVDRDNEPAIGLYKKFGFGFSGRSEAPGIYTEPHRSLIMDLTLS